MGFKLFLFDLVCFIDDSVEFIGFNLRLCLGFEWFFFFLMELSGKLMAVVVKWVFLNVVLVFTGYR